VVQIHPEWSYGARSLYSLVSVLQLDGFFSIDERPIRAVQFNTHAYLSDFYLDFGVYGVVLLSYFLGAMVKFTYIYALQERDVLSESVWIAFAFASSMLFFSNHFTGLTYPILSFIFFHSYRAVSQTIMHRYR
jgi:oligosaccharide repeat unit polymerase